MGSGHDRPAQVASEFARELGMLLARGGSKDPRITGLVTVTGAKMGRTSRTSPSTSPSSATSR